MSISAQQGFEIEEDGFSVSLGLSHVPFHFLSTGSRVRHFDMNSATDPNMRRGELRAFVCRTVIAAIAFLAAENSLFAADSYPTRPIKIIVNTAPGGILDTTTRLVARQLGEVLKQSVVVENRAGGDGLIGIRVVKSAPADGYTLLATTGTIAQQMALQKDPGYEVSKDFSGIGIMGRSGFIMEVGPADSDKNLEDFISRAKAHPGGLSYATPGIGTVPHFAIEKFLQQMDLKVVHVPYRGNAPALPDVMSGRVSMIFDTYPTAGSQIKSGQLKAIGVTSSARMAALPTVPTFAEQGVNNYSFYTWAGLVAPAGTPQDVLQRLAGALRTATSTKAIQDRFRDQGIETVNLTPQEFNQLLAQEAEQDKKLVNELGIKRQ
jgi:tripartite-type tricarboxylate transporter receptor subunit TctC